MSIKLNVSSKQQPKHIIDSSRSSSSSSTSNVIFPRNHDEYVHLLHSAQRLQDECTTQQLAKDVLSKSRTIDHLVANLPGIDRTQSMQMERISELITLNHNISQELEEAYVLANIRREKVRQTLRENTCLALGIEEEEDVDKE